MHSTKPQASHTKVRESCSQAQLNMARASAVYENKSFITLESKSSFRVAEFRKLVDR